MTDRDVTIEVTESEVSTSSKLRSPAFAAWVNPPSGSLQLSSKGELTLSYLRGVPDKMQIPDDYPSRLALIRYYYEHDPIANTAIDKQVEVGVNELVIDRNGCEDSEFEAYKYAKTLFMKYLKEAALEYLLSGLVIPQVSWVDLGPADIGLEGGSRRYTLPDKCWLVDPALIELQHVPFSTEVEAYMEIPEGVRKFITSGGKRPDGSIDTETITRLREEYPEFVKAIKDGKSRVLLEDAFIIRRHPQTHSPYPTPYLLSALESLIFKRNLKKMDYSIAARVIGAIQLIKLGNDEYPITEDDVDQFEELKTQMLWRGKQDNVDRVFQLFANHTVEISWVYPDTEAMLDQGKYEAINADIFNALGVPRILVSGETLRSATSQAEFAMYSPAESIKRMRETILTWIDELLDQIKERNNFKNRAKVYFEELYLYDLGKLAEIAVTLYQNNAISLTSLAGIAGWNFEEELLKKANERELMKEHNVPEFPPLPFSPQPGVPGGQQPGTPGQEKEDQDKDDA